MRFRRGTDRRRMEAEQDTGMPDSISAERFVTELEAHRSPEDAKKYLRYFKTGQGEHGEGDVFIGRRDRWRGCAERTSTVRRVRACPRDCPSSGPRRAATGRRRGTPGGLRRAAGRARARTT